MKAWAGWDHSWLGGIERPSRYIGGEFGLRGPVATATPGLRVALGFPDVYEVGMSHLGFRLLHAGLAARADLQVERVFLPWPDLQERLLAERRPLSTLEKGTPIGELDLLGLSLQYELALPAVLRMLDLGQIPRRTVDRAGGRWPVILIGGAGALNPEPLAPFVDAFFIGEADLAIHEIVDAVAATRQAPREARLLRLAAVSGIYLPELCTPGEHGERRAQPPARLPVQRRYVEDLDTLPPATVHLVPTCALVHDRVTVEIQRGCCQGCRFCQAGFVSRPTRQRGVPQVVALAREQLRQTGYEDLSLLSLSAGDHPRLQQMLAALIEEHGPSRVSLSLPSMRTESLHPAVAEHISKVRKTGFTLAPEAATDRLRRLINKGNREQDLLDSVAAVVRLGYQQIKLYFMIGLPTETDEDVVAIASLGERVMLEAQRAARHPVRLTLSISSFVPKPFTPFQWEPFAGLLELRRRQRLLQARVPRRIRLKWHDPGQSLVEAYLARADRSMAVVLDRLVTADYLGLDAWTEHFQLDRWQQALAEAQAAGELPGDEALLGPRDPASPLPWDFIDVGVTRSYLERERQASLRGELRPDCCDGTCDQCGVCPDEPLHRLAPETGGALPRGGVPEAAAAPAGEAPPPVLRLWFRKRGRAALISHLEMTTVFERAARRAGLPLCFSSGFHPKPKLRFSPALPLGAESLCELVEIPLACDLPRGEAARRLAAELPEGLELTSGDEAGAGLLGSLEGVRWLLQLPAAGPGSRELLARAEERLLAGASVRRRGDREIRLADAVSGLQAAGDRAVLVCCRMQPGGTPRPVEIMTELLGLDAGQATAVGITRVGWQVQGREVPESLTQTR